LRGLTEVTAVERGEDIGAGFGGQICFPVVHSTEMMGKNRKGFDMF